MKPIKALLLLPILAACATKEAPAPAMPQDAAFTATDFAFSGPDTLAPGFTNIRLVNSGSQIHHMILAKLEDGKTVQDLMKFFEENPNAEPDFAVWLGAASGIASGDSAGSTVDLAAGNYVMMCFVPDPADNTPHLMKGMTKELVVAGEGNGATAPAATAEIRTHDFGFTVPTLVAGTQTLHYINDGPATHEIQLVRLNDGATKDQYLAAMAPGATAPPPGVEKGGPGALSSGRDNYWTVTLEPGNYLLVCWVPDAEGTPHIMQGMVQEVTIPAAS